MRLHGYPGSPNTWKVRAVAAHLGLPLELELVDLGKGEQQSAGYLALNPTGRTPTLVDGDFVLWEATAIMHYLASQTPNTLFPADARSRADILRWQSWTLQHWGGEACEPLIFENFVKGFFDLGPPDPAVLEKATAAFHRDAEVLETHLSRRQYLVGNGVTLADFSLAPMLIYAKESALPVERYRHLRNWFERVFSLPAWAQTAPPAPASAA